MSGSLETRRAEKLRALVTLRDWGRMILQRQPDAAKREEFRSLAFDAILRDLKHDYTLDELAMFERALSEGL